MTNSFQECSNYSKYGGLDFNRLRSGPFEGPGIVIPPALPEDTYREIFMKDMTLNCSPGEYDLIRGIYEDFSVQFQKSIAELQSRGKSDLADLMKKRGYSIFYNDPRVTLKPGKVYLVGLNPGGRDTEDYDSEGDEDLEWWEAKERKLKHPFSSYLDDEWFQGRGEGNSPHQKNVCSVLSHLRNEIEPPEEAARSTCCVNLYFYRTPNVGKLQAYPMELLDCWLFHERFLEIVRPEIIICNGNADALSSFSVFREKFEKKQAVNCEPINKWRSVKWFVTPATWSAEKKLLIIGIPHLSRPYASVSAILKAINIAIEKASLNV